MRRNVLFVTPLLVASAVALAVAGEVQVPLGNRKTLTLGAARVEMAGAIAETKKGAGTGAIANVDDGGHLVMLERLDGTFSAGTNISIGNAHTSAMFKKPIRAFEEIIKNGHTAMVALSDFTPLQGGVLLLVDGQVVGAIGVSGAAGAQQDEEIAIAGANAVTGSTSGSTQGSARDVHYFDRERVAWRSHSCRSYE